MSCLRHCQGMIDELKRRGFKFVLAGSRETACGDTE
jgi:hypothetical protein